MTRKKNAILYILVAAMLTLSFNTSCTIGNIPTITFNPIGSRSDGGQEVIDQAWQVILDNYVEKDKIDTGNMTAEAIRGMMEALNDPYSSYLSPHAYQMSQSDLTGTFQGIGAYVGVRNDQITIIAPMPGSPAEEAGISSGDIILEIDGESTAEMGLEEAVLHIRGPGGTTVRLKILHLGETEPVDIQIVRASIEIKTVDFEMKGDIAYFRIREFNQRTDVELTASLKEMEGKGATGIILDLRSNPGGLVDVVVSVASHFIKDGVVIYLVDNRGEKTSQSVKPTGVTTSLPMVALSDNFSASGSEVLMGALQDYGRATIAGTITFGKGSYDSFFPLKDGSGIYLTIGRWATPNGRLIEGQGITPDIELTLHGDNATQWAVDFLHDKNN
jgi:carboxyl-terminal processing protease